MHYIRSVCTLVLTLACSNIAYSTDLSVNKIELTSGTLPSGFSTNSPDEISTGFQGTIDLIDRSEGRIVIGDQSVQLTRDTELTTDKKRQLYSLRNLKQGMTVRVDTEFNDGKMEAIAVHELNIPNN